MDRYICIHAHCYQPPRENPWLEFVELQDSAYPFHDWNERITAECYAPNGRSRVLDGAGRIVRIVNNYSRISFNFGPTLLSWLEAKAPETYNAILEADQQSRERFSGHGSAMAQAYNHMILPLANSRDKRTQIAWGIADFEHRFNRKPEGMWLAETAVDLESLGLIAEMGLKFTVLSPFQAARVRKLRAGGRWKDVSGGGIDPSHPYLVRLPGGRSIAVFFYDGPISQAVAFEKLLNSGEQFANRLMQGFSGMRTGAQLVHIATDGESYGHHHAHGDMALAYALEHIEKTGMAQLTNYGEFLEKFPPTHEAQIHEQSAWSCSHGVSRWMSHCGCAAGGNGWTQHWRGPLRFALDWLRDMVMSRYEKEAGQYFENAWRARDQYIGVVLDRTPQSLDRFFASARRDLGAEERIHILKLMEMQRHAMLMYTSCGWFFDELSGLETVQVIQYAGRVVQLAHELFEEPESCELESGFLERLQQAKSNLAEHKDGAEIYRKWVKPTMIALEQVAAHWAIASVFETGSRIYCYTVDPRGYQARTRDDARIAVGRARVCSRITTECEEVAFAVLHSGDYALRAGVGRLEDISGFEQSMRKAMKAFDQGDMEAAEGQLTAWFGHMDYSLRSLFRDEQRRIVESIRRNTLADIEQGFRQIYDKHAPLIRTMSELGMPGPRPLLWAAEFVLNNELRQAATSPHLDAERFASLMQRAQQEQVPIDKAGLAYALGSHLNRRFDLYSRRPANRELLEELLREVELISSLGLQVNLWKAQNVYYDIAQRRSGELGEWRESFLELGRNLGIAVEQFEPQAELAEAS